MILFGVSQLVHQVSKLVDFGTQLGVVTQTSVK